MNAYITKVSEDLRGASASELNEVAKYVYTLLKNKNNLEMFTWRTGQDVQVVLKGLKCKARVVDVKRVWVVVELLDDPMVYATGHKIWRVKPSVLTKI